MENRIKRNDICEYKIKRKDGRFECPACGYIWKEPHDLSFNEYEKVPCCPDCGVLIEDGGDDD